MWPLRSTRRPDPAAPVDDGTFFGGWSAANANAARPRQPEARASAAGGPATAVTRRRGMRRTAVLAAGLLACTTVVVTTRVTASADPSANDWYRLRMCESSNNYAINTGNAHYGAYQFDLSTWRSVGGSGYPHQASPAEQDRRALLLYRMRGWQPWQCASIVGLREDGDARSGRTTDLAAPPRTPSGGSGVPAFPGSRWYTYGDWNSDIKRFQDQMHARGFFPVGTGEYGPNTLRMVKRLQSLNGLVPNGYIGPNTWRMAWVGKYSESSSGATATKPAAAKTPARFPGTRWYRYGDRSADIKKFQDAMHARGYFPVGTGEYGPNTLRMVKRLQSKNGLIPNGLIGPKTWKLAWTGKY
jgi:peptidoglycan hydrolase-like protein with peptidoglycan-binding domain